MRIQSQQKKKKIPVRALHYSSIQSYHTISLINAYFSISSGLHGVTERTGHYVLLVHRANRVLRSPRCIVESIDASQMAPLQVKVPGDKVPARSPSGFRLIATLPARRICQELDSRGAYHFIGEWSE